MSKWPFLHVCLVSTKKNDGGHPLQISSLACEEKLSGVFCGGKALGNAMGKVIRVKEGERPTCC